MAPAVICGIDPADGKSLLELRVCLPKNLRWQDTIGCSTTVYSGGHQRKCQNCLHYLSDTVTSGVLQGDLLFTDDKKTENIDGKSYITFRPNTLTYAVGSKHQDRPSSFQRRTRHCVPHQIRWSQHPRDVSIIWCGEIDYNVSNSVWAVSASFQNVGGVTPSVSQIRELQQYASDRQGSIKQAGSIFTDIQSGKKTLQIDTMFLQFFNSYYRRVLLSLVSVRLTTSLFVTWATNTTWRSTRIRPWMSRRQGIQVCWCSGLHH